MSPPDFLFELHANLPRQGPGDAESTRRAWRLLEDLPVPTRLLDVGCGSGAQTLELARLIDGEITAIDIHEPFLQQLRERAERQGVAGRIDARNLSMFEMDFPDASFEVIWSEGAIYIYGFAEALRDWRPMLASGGYLVCSHICWLTDSPPDEVVDFWQSEYPAISTVTQNRDVIRQVGYTAVADFVLPAASWWSNYYEPLEARIERMRETHADDAQALELLDATEREIEMFRRHSDSYGYVFFVMRR